MRSVGLIGALILVAASAAADDWPQYFGERRDGVWREPGVVKKLPAEGPKVLWRAPVALGYAGPAVVDGRVFLTDFVLQEGKIINNAGAQVKISGLERVRCFDASNGEPIWMHSEERTYEVSYPSGPRATPTVANGQVFALGAMGHLRCLSVDGELQWQKNFEQDYGARVPMWGHSAAPLVYQDSVICMVGGPGSLVVAFDRKSGEEKWRALEAGHCGYCPPQIIEHAGEEMLITWHPNGVSGHDPETGKVYWTVPIKPTGGSAIALPRKLGNKLFVSGYNRIGGLLELGGGGDQPPTAKIAWRSGPKSGVYPVNSSPILLEDTIYAVDVDRSALMAVRMSDGERLWETRAPCLAKEIAERERVPRYGSAFLTYHEANRQFWILGEMGDLIIAELSPEGYREVSRAHVLAPTNTSGSRAVLWSMPAFSMKSCFVRNDQELIRIDLSE